MEYSFVEMKKAQLDKLRPYSPEMLQNLESWFEVELTYSSNAIEGNTLTRAETALVLEKGITVGGKPLKDHLEAVNHRQALIGMRKLVNDKGLQLDDILMLHHSILHGIDDANAGKFRRVAVRISGSSTILPNPVKIPFLMGEYIRWLNGAIDIHPVEKAALAHYRLVTIHPFIDGNGRTARLVMNLLLMQAGYPPAIIRPRDRLKYIKALEQAQLGGSLVPFLNLITKTVERSLDIYLDAFTHKPVKEGDFYPIDQLFRIGKLSELGKISVPTIRYWVKMGLLTVVQTTSSGYQLFSPLMVERIRKIRELKSKRYTLEEIILMLIEK